MKCLKHRKQTLEPEGFCMICAHDAAMVGLFHLLHGLDRYETDNWARFSRALEESAAQALTREQVVAFWDSRGGQRVRRRLGATD